MNSDTPTGFDYFTLGVAALGVLLGGASLLWQIVLFRLTGSRVKLLTIRAVAAIDAQTTVRLVGIRAANKGRTPVAVTGIGFLPQGTDHQLTLLWPRLFGGPKLPHTLDTGQEASWLIPEDEVKQTLTENQWGPSIRAYVDLGTGKRAIARGGQDL